MSKIVYKSIPCLLNYGQAYNYNVRIVNAWLHQDLKRMTFIQSVRVLIYSNKK